MALRSPTRLPVAIVAYCATCDKAWDGREEHLGVRFLCPQDDPSAPSHLTAVVKGRAGKFWLQVENKLLRWEVRQSPMRWFHDWGGVFKGRDGFYAFLRLVVVVLALVGASFLPSRCEPKIVLGLVLGLLSFLAIVDVLLSSTSIAFVSRFPAHPLRSALITLVSFVTLATSFAVFYQFSPASFNVSLNPLRAAYFSTVTLATLGYGDIHPATGAWWYQLLVMVELFVGLYFLVILFAIVSSWAGARPQERVLASLASLTVADLDSRSGEHQGA